MTGSTLNIILITASFALLVFIIAYIVVSTLLADRIAAEKRLDELNKKEGDFETVALIKNESKKTRRKRERKKQKSNLADKFGDVLFLELQSADIKMRPEEFTLIWILLAFIPGGLLAMLTGNMIISMVLVVAGILLPIMYVKSKQKSRVKKFEEQLSDALMLCCSCLRSGLSFTQAMETIAKDMDAPISTEFENAIRELNMGYSMEECLENMADRIKSKYVELMVSAVLVQRQTGGNLSHILENISDTIKEKMKLKRQLKTSTASGKMSGFIVGAMPLIMLLIMTAMQREMMMVLFTENRGRFVLVGVAVLEVLAFVAIKKITTVKM